jgi:hypothetical protein
MRLENSTIRQVAICVWIISTFARAQAGDTWVVFDTGTQASLRGLAAVNNEVAWACGSKATIVQTIDGGDSWKVIESSAIPKMDTGEAGFAASNSSLHTFGDTFAWLGGASVGPSRVPNQVWPR